MKLKINELKKFNSIAAGLPQNKILPILSYIKFENGFITKNNLESFVTMDADFKGICLIDEKVLMSFVETTTAKEIDVEIDGNKVVIYNSENKREKVSSPTEDIKNFPVNSMADGEEIELSNDILSKIKVASSFTLEREQMPYTQCVFVGKGLVAATTGFVAYTEKIEEKTPEIILGKNAVSALNNFNEVTFSENKTYQFFNNHIFKFGFIKDDTKFVDMTPFSKIPNDNQVKIDKSEMIRFCERCIKSSSSKIIVANIKGDKLIMTDSDYGIECEGSLSTVLDDFSFNPSLMYKMLRSLPDQEVLFVRHTNKYFVTGESGFVSLIMEMQS